MQTVREALAASRPHLSLKAVWPVLIRTLRASGQATCHLASRSQVDRWLGEAVHGGMDIGAMKELLLAFSQAPTESVRVRLALEIDGIGGAWLTQRAEHPVQLQFSGWPTGFTPEHRRLIGGPGVDGDAVDPVDAAIVIRDLDGMNVAGSVLRVSADLPDGVVLPPIPRDLRHRLPDRNRDSWLPHLSEEGRFSLSPEPIAAAHAQMFCEVTDTVLDLFCGCGGDAIACAKAGLRVHAVDHDSDQIHFATENARHFDVQDRIEFHCAEATAALPGLLHAHPTAGVYLDPPWGGPDWNRTEMGWKDLVPASLGEQLQHAHVVVLKAPRSFLPDTLPKWGAPWSLQPGLGTAGRSPGDRLPLITFKSRVLRG